MKRATLTPRSAAPVWPAVSVAIAASVVRPTSRGGQAVGALVGRGGVGADLALAGKEAHRRDPAIVGGIAVSVGDRCSSASAAGRVNETVGGASSTAGGAAAVAR